MIRQNNENNNLVDAANWNPTILQSNGVINLNNNSITLAGLTLRANTEIITSSTSVDLPMVGALRANLNPTEYNNIGFVNVHSQNAELSLAGTTTNILTNAEISNSIFNLTPSNQSTTNIVMEPTSCIKIAKGFKGNIDGIIRINGITISQEIISKISANQEILIKSDEQGNITTKLEVILLSNFSAYSCFPKNDYHDHNDYNDNGGEGFGILIGDSNPMPIEVC